MDEWLTFLPFGTLPSIRRDLGLSYSEAGILLAALPAGGLLGTPLGGLAADYLDRRLLSAAGAFAYGIAMIVFGLSDTLWVSVAAAAAWGAASDPFVHPSAIALVELYPDDVEKNISRQNLFSAVGDLLSPLTIVAAVAVGIDWRPLLLGGGLLMLLYGLWFLSLPALPPGPRDEERTPLASLLSVARDGRVIRLSAILVAFSILDEAFAAFVLLYLMDYRELSPLLSVVVAGALIAGTLPGHAAVPYLTPRFASLGLRNSLAALMSVAAAAIVLAPLWPLALIGALATGFAMAALYSLLDARLMTVRPGQAGATITFSSYVDSVALGFPLVAGVVASQSGLFAAMFVYLLVPFAVLLALISDQERPTADPD